MITQVHYFPHCSYRHAAARPDALSGKSEKILMLLCHEAASKFFHNNPNVQGKGFLADFSTGGG